MNPPGAATAWMRLLTRGKDHYRALSCFYQMLRQDSEERGKKGGRKPVVTLDELARAQAHIAAGLTVRRRQRG
jgi:hypothetical protein